LRAALRLLPFFCQYFGLPRSLHSFPTRRSSDLLFTIGIVRVLFASLLSGMLFATSFWLSLAGMLLSALVMTIARRCSCFSIYGRSEEHTSELQSRFDLVCRLLLEKKKLYELRIM